MRRDCAVAHLLLHTLRKQLDQAHPTGHPTRTAIKTPRQFLQPVAEALLQFNQQPALLERRLVIARTHRPVKKQSLHFAQRPEDRRPNTSKPAPGHRIYPYLLRGLAVTRPNQAWAMDITYIPMARDFVYLAAVVDWFSRRVLAWRLSITMDTSFCIEALEEALSKNEKPEIFNTDQGSQFTSEAFTGRLKENGIAVQSLSSTANNE